LNTVLLTHVRPDGRQLVVVQGDITEEDVDAIVNAANGDLAHGGGVAGAIVRRGGREIQDESTAWVRLRGPIATGGAAITSGGKLKARHVIHAVGPVWGTGNEEALLEAAVRSAMTVAEQAGVRSLSLPAISTGIYGYPRELGVPVILGAVQTHLDANPRSALQEVRFCNIDSATAGLFADALSKV
jgi:putative ATPase